MIRVACRLRLRAPCVSDCIPSQTRASRVWIYYTCGCSRLACIPIFLAPPQRLGCSELHCNGNGTGYLSLQLGLECTAQQKNMMSTGRPKGQNNGLDRDLNPGPATVRARMSERVNRPARFARFSLSRSSNHTTRPSSRVVSLSHAKVWSNVLYTLHHRKHSAGTPVR